MPPRKLPYFVESAPRADGSLSIVRVEEGWCVMSTGEVLIVRFEKQRALLEWLCQERGAVSIRVWIGRDGPELIDVRPDGERPTEISTDTTSSSEVF